MSKNADNDWRSVLDVINCADDSAEREVVGGNVYMCPADETGNYSHRRCEFFGMYRGTCVEKIALVSETGAIEQESGVGKRRLRFTESAWRSRKLFAKYPPLVARYKTSR